jgi:arylformamidase
VERKIFPDQLNKEYYQSHRKVKTVPKYIDITRKLQEGTAVWPGDKAYYLSQSMAISKGQSVNLSSIALSAHTGSHIDAPYHFDEGGRRIEQLPIDPFWGTAQVVSVKKKAGPLVLDDFKRYKLELTPRLLVRSAASSLDQSIFPGEFVYPSPELVDYLGSLGLILYGTDCPSMDHPESKTLDGHRALGRNNIAILEWLDLSQAADGLYELVALPLRIVGGDGSPVRAVLRVEEGSQ